MDTGEKYRFVLNDWIKLLEESDSWREIAVYQDEPEDKLPGRSSVAHTESHSLYCTLQGGASRLWFIHSHKSRILISNYNIQPITAINP